MADACALDDLSAPSADGRDHTGLSPVALEVRPGDVWATQAADASVTAHAGLNEDEMSDCDRLQQDNSPQANAVDRSAAGKTAAEPGGRAAKALACPVCGKPATQAHKPFCGPRCADVDLNRWLTGSYVIPGRPIDEVEDD